MKSNNFEIGDERVVHAPKVSQTQDVGVMRDITPGESLNSSSDDGLINQIEISPCLSAKSDDPKTGGSLSKNMSFGLKPGPSTEPLESNLMGICARDPTIVQNEAIQLLQSKDGLFHSLAKIAHSLRLAFPDSFTGSGETVDQFLKLSRDYFQFEEKCTTLNSELRKSGSTEVDFGFHMRSKFLAEVSLLDESDKGRSIPVVAENSSPSSLEATLKSDGPVEGNSGISRSLEFDLPVNDLENNIRADTNVTISSNTGVSPVPLDNTSFSKSDCRKIYPTLEYPNNPGSAKALKIARKVPLECLVSQDIQVTRGQPEVYTSTYNSTMMNQKNSQFFSEIAN